MVEVLGASGGQQLLVCSWGARLPMGAWLGRAWESEGAGRCMAMQAAASASAKSWLRESSRCQAEAGRLPLLPNTGQLCQMRAHPIWRSCMQMARKQMRDIAERRLCSPVELASEGVELHGAGEDPAAQEQELNQGVATGLNCCTVSMPQYEPTLAEYFGCTTQLGSQRVPSSTTASQSGQIRCQAPSPLALAISTHASVRSCQEVKHLRLPAGSGWQRSRRMKLHQHPINSHKCRCKRQCLI